jgi:transcriptional regulator GlxA family with amidase domain
LEQSTYDFIEIKYTNNETGKIITAAGVSAGIDMGFLLAAKISGQSVAESLQLGLEYDPKPPFDSGSPQKAKPDILANVQAKLMTRFEPL